MPTVLLSRIARVQALLTFCLLLGCVSSTTNVTVGYRARMFAGEVWSTDVHLTDLGFIYKEREMPDILADLDSQGYAIV